MHIIKLLKRKDASSVVVAVALAIFLGQVIELWSGRPASWLSGLNSNGGGWRIGFWRPLFTLLVEVIILEVVIRVYTYLMKGKMVK
jgi:hypothetical protein